MADYDKNTDYKALMDKAAAEGDYAKAAEYEQLRNQKIADMNAEGGGTNKYGATQTNNYSQYLNGNAANNQTGGSSGYTSKNDAINGNPDAHYAEVDLLKQWYAQNPTASQQMTWEQLLALGQQYGIDVSQFNQYSQNGGYTKDRNTAIAGGGTGDPVDDFYADGTWYYYPGQDRNDVAGTSGADEHFLSNGAYAVIQGLKKDWAMYDDLAKQAAGAGNMDLANQYYAQRDQAHIQANQIRQLSGYSGGADGSMYIPNAQLGIDDSRYPYHGGYGGVNRPTSGIASSGGMSSVGSTGGGSTGGGSTGTGTTPTQQNVLQELLEAWKEASESQSNGQIDYAVEKAITDLERALADAQPQFKEQAESVDRDARQAMDNSALYAEMRGDKGGIGQEQYNSIQNTQAQNHLTVQQAQTKLATDTQRQIADLRAQGEFEKADAALQITQQYLQQLISLEQWAAQYNLSVEQFNAQLQQWEAEYNLAMKQFETGKQQWESEFGFQQQQYQNSLNQWQQEFDFAQQQYQNSLDQWEREFAAEQMLAQMKLANSGNPNRSMTLAEAKALADDGVFTEQSLAVFYENGYTDEHLKDLYRYKPPVEPQTSRYDSESVARLGLGSNVSDAYIDQLLNEGKLQFFVADGKIYVYWADNYGLGGIPTAPLPSFLQLGNLSTGGNNFVRGSTGGGYSGGGGASGDPTLYGVKN